MAQPGYKLYSDIEYAKKPGVDPELLSLDIYVPDASLEQMPVVIYVHGGGWSLGDKHSVGDKPIFFTKQGFIFVSINYRLSPKTLGSPDTHSKIFPMHAIDVAYAIRWIHDHIRAYNGSSDDLILMGHSAGAHLVNIIATNEKYLHHVGLDLTNIAGICSLDAGVFDVDNAIKNAKGQARKNMLLSAFGYDAAVYHEASPILQVDNAQDYPPFMLVYQSAYKRMYWNETFGQKLKKAGSYVFNFEADEYDHIQINNKIGSDRDFLGLSEAILKFIRYCTE